MKIHTYLQMSGIRYVSGTASTIGLRAQMEDTIIVSSMPTHMHWGLYDGHGGKEAADLAAPMVARFLEEATDIPGSLVAAFAHVQSTIESTYNSAGSTALVAHFSRSAPVGWVANLGDSRAILVDGHTVRQITKDHKPDDPFEHQIIRDRGGWVRAGRVNGTLAVSRALGDTHLDLCRSPDLFPVDLTEGTLVMACDGVWDVLSNYDVGEIVRAFPDHSRCAEEIKRAAIHANSQDNISVVVLSVA